MEKPKHELIQELEIRQLDLLDEIDKLQRGLAILYLDKKLAQMKPLIPQLTRRWEEFHRTISQLEALLAPYEPHKPRQITKLTPFDYSGRGYDYN